MPLHPHRPFPSSNHWGKNSVIPRNSSCPLFCRRKLDFITASRSRLSCSVVVGMKYIGQAIGSTCRKYMAKARSNLVVIPIMAPDVAVVVLIIVAQVMSCKGLIREANVLAIFAGALLCMTHLLACLLAACFISQPDDTGKACLHRQRARNALLGAWIAFVTAILALVAALPPHSPFTSCGDGRMVFAGLYSIMHGIFLVQYYVSSITADEEMVE